MARFSTVDRIVRGGTSPVVTSAVCTNEHGTFARLWRKQGSLLFALDVLICLGSFVGSYFIRFHEDFVALTIVPPFPTVPEFLPYLKAALLATSLWIFLLARERSYGNDLHFSTGFAFQVRLVLVSGFYSLVFLMVISFMFRHLLLSRIVYVMGFALACGLMILVRFSFQLVGRSLSNGSVTVYSVLLMGWNRYAAALLNRLSEQNRCTRVIGRLDWGTSPLRPINCPAEIPVLGTVNDLESVYDSAPFDQLIVVTQGQGLDHDNTSHRNALVKTLNFCEEKGVSFYMVPDFLDVAVMRRELGTFSGVPLVRLRDSALHPVYGVAKRIMDIAMALTVLVIGLPLWLMIAVLIKATSKGPVFYMQERVGLHGRPFSMYKFRSMVQDADARLKELVDFNAIEEPVFNIRKDPRVTSIGKFLRRTSLDEIPQLLNVLGGSMSVIGPRPERVELVLKYTPSQRRRLKAKPGITGYQQVMSRGDPSLTKRIEYDLHYLKHQSFFLDLFILLKTVVVILRGDGMK
jgi:exopolysaccharide biosynthesis polyprenyl glycosylphosphotransferase